MSVSVDLSLLKIWCK